MPSLCFLNYIQQLQLVSVNDYREYTHVFSLENSSTNTEGMYWASSVASFAAAGRANRVACAPVVKLASSPFYRACRWLCLLDFDVFLPVCTSVRRQRVIFRPRSSSFARFILSSLDNQHPFSMPRKIGFNVVYATSKAFRYSTAK